MGPCYRSRLLMVFPMALYWASSIVSSLLTSLLFLSPVQHRGLPICTQMTGRPTIHPSMHSFSQTISIVPHQVHFYSEALPTQHGYCAGVSRRSATGNCELKTCSSLYVAARAGVEPTTLRFKSASLLTPLRLYVLWA